ncbi:translocator protein, LysE family [Synechococcus sp. PCC 7335]|uniref:LysE family translocator n=1 Tax=Synechococcus sp. (strain ATCC 29403 / PCC 7335) TaxID=91464 RepID=UPI00017EE02F|nr:LysE family translocator [Synechococcus sp. PCC 7335]EDX86670.1 translocator protein, LysE family [Synechococcus sp. PCC 7335]
MSSEVIVALCLFAIATSITPGPNNIMLLASGVNFGFQRTLPHTLGISGGLFVLLISVGLGLGFLFTTFPVLQLVLKIVGSAYMLYLAVRIATSRSLVSKEPKVEKSKDQALTEAQPLNMFEAALFQWVNPKAWVMAISGMSLYTSSQQPVRSTIIVTILFSVLNWPCVCSWALFGSALRGFLADPVRLRWFNVAMGALLAASIVLLLK